MISEINKKTKEILDNFLLSIKAAEEKRDKKIEELIERAEEKYVDQIKKDINL